MSTLLTLLVLLATADAPDARYPAEVDVPLAYVHAQFESDLDPCAVSRVVAGHRVSGHFPCRVAFPREWRGPFFCGLWMTESYTEQSCRDAQDTVVAWETRRVELRAWLDAEHGDLRRAISGYGCGYWGAAHPAGCGHGYADRLLSKTRSKQWKKH